MNHRRVLAKGSVVYQRFVSSTLGALCLLRLTNEPQMCFAKLVSCRMVGHHRKVTLTTAWLHSDYHPTFRTQQAPDKTTIRHGALDTHFVSSSYSWGANVANYGDP